MWVTTQVANRLLTCPNYPFGHGLQNLWLHFGVDEHPFATYFDVHQGYRVLGGLEEALHPTPTLPPEAHEAPAASQGRRLFLKAPGEEHDSALPQRFGHDAGTGIWGLCLK